MTAVPHGWQETTLGELGRYLNGRAFKKSEWAPEGRPIIRIQNLTGSGASFNFFAGEVEDRYVVRPGDLLISWAATLGSYIWNGPEAVVNQHIFKVESNIEVRFHKYLLDFKLGELMRHTHGSGMVHITRGKFDAIPVVVPPLEEQRRIVDALESHFSRIASSRVLLEQASARMEVLRRAQFDRLLWSDPTVPTTLLHTLLSEKMRNGHSARTARSGIGVRTLTLTAVTRNHFGDEHTKLADVQASAVRDLWLREGDILVQRSNTPELVGTAAMYEGPNDWAIFPDLVIRVRVDRARVLPEYLVAVLRSDRSHRELRSKAKGLAGSMPKVDQAAIGALPIPLPNLSRQVEIVGKAAELELAHLRLRAQLRLTDVRAQRLRDSVLTAALSGRLGAARNQNEPQELAGV